jgi:peptidoglycan/LPS O-acetylase OafA/YrhL
VLPFGLLGLAWTRRRGTWPRAQVLLTLSWLLVCVVFLPQERFRLSGLDPTLVIGAAACWALRGRAAIRPDDPGAQR